MLSRPERLQLYQDSVRDGLIVHPASEQDTKTSLVDADIEAQVDIPLKSTRKCYGLNWTFTLTLVTIGYMLQLLKKVLILKARKETCSVYCQVKGQCV